MRIFPVLVFMLLLGAPLMAQSNGALVAGVQGASGALRAQLSGGQASAVWTGLGLVSGDMVDLQLTNLSGSPQTFRFVPGMVLSDPGQQAQPIMLDENLEFTLRPGETVKRKMRGYCLDFAKEPPAAGQEQNYEVPADIDSYRAAVAVLYSALRLEGEDKLHPVLRPQMHRTVTTQRAMWAALGGKNPDSKEDLRRDIEKEIGQNSSIFPTGQLDCLSQRLWSDVQQIMAEAQANE